MSNSSRNPKKPTAKKQVAKTISSARAKVQAPSQPLVTVDGEVALDFAEPVEIETILPPKPKLTLERFMGWLLLIGGAIGLVCSFIIMYEKIQILQNPHYIPSCNLNPIISCGSVMSSAQSHIFGFPNPFIGLIAFPVLITLGVMTLSRIKLKRWHWIGLELGSIFGLALVHWLFFQSVYRIHALCPYCMVVWVVTISTFWYSTLYNLQLSFNKLSPSCQRFAAFLRRHHLDILLFWLLVIAAFILKHFWYYYGKHL